jgi:hypothetical protein
MEKINLDTRPFWKHQIIPKIVHVSMANFTLLFLSIILRIVWNLGKLLESNLDVKWLVIIYHNLTCM